MEQYDIVNRFARRCYALARAAFMAQTCLHHNPNKIRVGAFVSIPKNGSKSVLKILGLGQNRDLEDTTSLVIYENHQRAELLAERYDLENLFVFCFCRNPYDRCVSWYEYHKKIEPYKSCTFTRWIQKRMPHHFKKQNLTDYVEKGISPLLQCNFTKGVDMTFVGRMEVFSQDMLTIGNELNSRCRNRKLRHRFTVREIKVNTSKRDSDYMAYYTPETRKIVANMLAEDFDTFKYST